VTWLSLLLHLGHGGWVELWAGAARGRESGASKLVARRAVSGPARNSPMLAPLFEARPLAAA
jgi:hypothetical protein